MAAEASGVTTLAAGEVEARSAEVTIGPARCMVATRHPHPPLRVDLSHCVGEVVIRAAAG